MSLGRPARQRLVHLATIICVVMAATLGLSVSAAHAYNTEGCYWPTIKNSGAFGWTDSDSGAGYTAFINAKNAWNATATKINLSGSGSGIVTESNNYGNTGYDGITNYSCSSGVFTHSQSNLNSYYTASYSTGERQSVAAHEFGHSLGLAHNNSSVCILMYYSSARWTSCGVNTPQSDDVNGINGIYGSP